ncbi:hypothetical protein C7H19_19560 [Aphanothece hegewaldii CCALA 016]|uniref:Uncharacterized protein n=1 Tax=Aphanothece hegewaldii CCALA 016 TaxID=2107694 RepID=A0A2T1LTE6_9CHRO|nr:hypothetical protein [Aphanothece hegewaldii]PSF33919.1 hypothetical protein C7H19_19560 [Aphanothece hegewaldii CCALA 016]
MNNQSENGIIIWPTAINIIVGWLTIKLWILFHFYWVIGIGSLIILLLLALQVKFYLNPVSVEIEEDE